MDGEEAPGPTPGPQSTPDPTAGFAPDHRVGGGRYALKLKLGSGGFGVVWLARDERLGEFAALKLLPEEIAHDPVALEDMRRETFKSRRLTHPNIVRIHDLFEVLGETPFIAMEYVDGETLTQLRLRQPQQVFTWEFLAPLASQLCGALNYAHDEEVVHRDLKPSNLMVDGKGRLKLADFGIAATISDSISRVSLRQPASGTLLYMSPQQMDGEPPRVTDDIYALGATLYELLTGKPPFHSGDIAEQVRNLRPAPMEERLAADGIVNPIPPAVSALVMACLAKDPGKRPLSVRAVAEWVGLDRVGEESVEGLVADLGMAVEAAEEETGPEKGKEAVRLAIGTLLVIVAVAGGWFFFQKPFPLQPPSPAKEDSAASQPSPPPLQPPMLPVQKTATPASEAGSGWVRVFDGQSLAGWVQPEPGDWRIEPDGSLVVRGPHCHLFMTNVFTNVEFKAQIKLAPNSVGGLYVRTDFSRTIAGRITPDGYEAKAANVGTNGYTGTLRGARGSQIISTRLVPDNTWFTLHMAVVNNRVVVKVNSQVVVDFVDTRPYNSGLLGLHQIDSRGVVAYRDLMVKALPANLDAALAELRKDIPELNGAPAVQPSLPSVAPTAPVPFTFTNLFNGRDLSGFKQYADYWSVKDGMLIGKTGPEGKVTVIPEIYITNISVGDFELKVTYRLSGTGPAVLTYRSDGRRPGSRPNGYIGTYGANLGDYEYGGVKGAGSLFGIVRGALSTNRSTGMTFRSTRLTSIGATYRPAPYRPDAWNELIVVASGPRLIHKLNGVVAVDFSDTDQARRASEGRIEITLPSLKDLPRTLEIRDLQLRRLPAVPSAKR